MLIQCAATDASNLDNGVLTITCLDEDNEVVYKNEYELDGLQLVQPAPAPVYVEGLAVAAPTAEIQFVDPTTEEYYKVSNLQSNVAIDVTDTPSITGTLYLVDLYSNEQPVYSLCLDTTNCDFTGYNQVSATMHNADYSKIYSGLLYDSVETPNNIRHIDMGDSSIESTEGFTLDIAGMTGSIEEPVVTMLGTYDISGITYSTGE